MGLESILFLSTCVLILWFNRWLVGKEIDLAKASFRQDALASALEVSKEREALADRLREAADERYDALAKQRENRQSIEANALPFFTSTDKEQAQIEKLMTDKGEDFLSRYQDEVPGLGR